MSEKKKKKKEKTNVVLPKAWQSVKHRNETAQTKTNLDDSMTAVLTIIGVLVLAFVLLGGVSQTGILRIIANWSQNVGYTISGWIEGTSIITNEDGIYIDPTGQQGEKIGGDSDVEIKDPSNIIDEVVNDEKGENEDTSSDDTTKQSNNKKKKNKEVKDE